MEPLMESRSVPKTRMSRSSVLSASITSSPWVRFTVVRPIASTCIHAMRLTAPDSRISSCFTVTLLLLA